MHAEASLAPKERSRSASVAESVRHGPRTSEDRQSEVVVCVLLLTWWQLR